MKSVGACHCSAFRRLGGGPLFEVECGPDVLFEGVENISTFRSSSWGERGFYKLCGTHLYMKVREDNELGLLAGYGIPAGLLANEEELVLATEVSIDQKPSYFGSRRPRLCRRLPVIEALGSHSL
ncbi:MAG: hypothetical protein ACI9JM_001593 [Halioglobus sp.]